MVNEDEHSVAEDSRQRFHLRGPVEHGLMLYSICRQIKDGAEVHHADDNKARYYREDLKVLGVLDVTEREGDAQSAEDGNAPVVRMRNEIEDFFLTAVQKKRDALVQALGPRRVLE